VRRLEEDSALQDTVLIIYHALDFTFGGPAQKIVENHLGRRRAKVAPQVVLQAGLGKRARLGNHSKVHPARVPFFSRSPLALRQLSPPLCHPVSPHGRAATLNRFFPRSLERYMAASAASRRSSRVCVPFAKVAIPRDTVMLAFSEASYSGVHSTSTL
jgi:hypothetical protein